MNRPFGVTFLAIIFALAGLSYILLGLQLTSAVTFGPVPAGTGQWFWGWVIVGTGVVMWGAGLACWSLQPWGWQVGNLIALIGLFEAFFIILGVGTLEYALVATGWPLLLFWYLHRGSTRKAFGIPDDI